jgi:hypothetical protein
VALCKRVASDHAKENAEGATFWVHRLDGAQRERWATAGPVVTHDARRADADVRDRAYRALLARLGLDAGHRAGLQRRGLDGDAVARGGYRTLPRTGRAKLAVAIAETLGEADARGVPGLYVAGEGARTWWSLAGSPGLLVPVRDGAGRLVALKVRRDEPGDGARYTYLSSAGHGGPSAEPAVHHPVGTRVEGVVRVTEGELKADVCTVLSGVYTVSVPGVGNWRPVLPALAALGASRVRVAFDADWRSNPCVARALAALVRALRAAGHDVTRETWDRAAGRGLDDVLCAKGASVEARA